MMSNRLGQPAGDSAGAPEESSDPRKTMARAARAIPYREGIITGASAGTWLSRRSGLGQESERLTGSTLLGPRDGARWPHRDHPAAGRPGLGAQVDDPVGRGDDV